MSHPDNTRPDDPRARAAHTKRSRTRRALLEAADATFGAKGWADTRMEDIAADAGVSAATAYNHFPSKHALMGHVYGPLLTPLLTRAAADAAAGRPMVAALTDQVGALSRVSFRHRALTIAFWSAVQDYTIRLAGPPDPDDELDPRRPAPVEESIRLLVEHGQRTGELRPFPSAVDVGAMVANLLLLRCAQHVRESPGTTAELLLTVLFGMLAPELLTAADRRPFAPPPED